MSRLYLYDAIVLSVFSLWDDIAEIGHYLKSLGQLIATLFVKIVQRPVLPVVGHGALDRIYE